MADVMAVPAIDEETGPFGFEARFDDADEGDDWEGNGNDPGWDEEEEEWDDEDEDEDDEWEEEEEWDDEDEWEDGGDDE